MLTTEVEVSMKTFTALLIFLLFSFPASAHSKKQLNEIAKKQCLDRGGTWSNFKGRCDTTHLRSPLRDKKWWAGEAIILAEGLASGIETNRIKTGGTALFGNCGACTTSADIAIFETAMAAWFSGLHAFEWYLGHDDPNKYWRFTSYAAIPTVAMSIGVFGIIHNNEVGPPAPKPALKNNPMYQIR